jgi:predicted RNase H-like HicB family nuclease
MSIRDGLRHLVGELAKAAEDAQSPGPLMAIRRLTAILEREGDGFVSLCPEVDVASQGDTIEHAWTNLQEASKVFFETVSEIEVAEPLSGEVYVTTLEVAVG